MPKNFVILGAGLTGLPLAHYVLKHYATKHDLKVILVSRSDEFYWNIATPRAAIPGQFTDDQVFFSIPKAFSKYPSQIFEFVLGNVEAWDPDENSVAVNQTNGQTRVLHYDTILVATGSDYVDNMPWKLVGTSQETRGSLAKLRDAVDKAKSIVVGGGGPTGVEFAGELGHEYAKAGKKEVTLVITDKLPLEAKNLEATRQAAKRELEKLKVKVIPSARVTNTTHKDGGGSILELTKADGTKEVLETDLFVPTWGITFNTFFAPSSLLEPNGRLKVTSSLRAPGYDNVFLAGDAANADSYAATIREPQVRYLATAIGQYLAGGKVQEYSPETKVGLAASVGPSRGVGQMGNFNMWSFLVWYFKARHMCTNVAAEYAAGESLILGSF
ncbi:Pyr-redox-2 domain-containing protein [Fusarium keratoplasticum]|uniref:Pyr-redox-2 domain-containing protein n=1 Tax=Fusarium keratoplasticum TaxID=1328300 RepID=A0ACC0QZ36_9HYPO|nr:Pyr-redox-2 domain-containing protein [Fusarium keratoplasticum]KAI8668922.1 Pyr-redox-2 domain-containing protein [Fusarium keratoplasticum]